MKLLCEQRISYTILFYVVLLPCDLFWWSCQSLFMKYYNHPTLIYLLLETTGLLIWDILNWHVVLLNNSNSWQQSSFHSSMQLNWLFSYWIDNIKPSILEICFRYSMTILAYVPFPEYSEFIMIFYWQNGTENVLRLTGTVHHCRMPFYPNRWL